MSYLRYFCKGGKLPFYTALSLAFGFLMALLLQAWRDVLLLCRLASLILLLMLLLRLADDIFDYEKDREKKAQPLTRRQLLGTAIVLMGIFTLLNLWFFGLPGLGGLLVLAYLWVQQKVSFMKPFFMPAASAFYFYVCNDAYSLGGTLWWAVGVYLALCLGASLLFYICKERKAG